MTVLRWGIIGCGLISGDFVEALALLSAEEHQVAAIAAHELERAQKFAQEHRLGNQTAVYGDYDQLIADPNVDVIYCGLLNPQHKAIVLSALEGGKHVLCEKPMGLNDQEVREMVEKAKEKKLFLQEAFWTRYFPVYQRIREEIRSGNVGEVRLVQANLAYGDMMETDRIRLLEQGGGVILDLGCYVVQFALWAMGADAKVEKIQVCGTRHETGVDKTVLFTLQFDKERFAQLMISGDAAMDGHGIISGTKGQLIIPMEFNAPETLIKARITPTDDPNCETIRHLRPDCDPERFYYRPSNGLAYEADAVRKHIQAGLKESPEIPWSESIKVAEILTEIRRQMGVKFPQEKE